MSVAAPGLPIVTARLALRPWRHGDRAPFAAMNADPHVMEHFPQPLSVAESDALVDRFMAHIDRNGFGFLAVEERASGAFIGFVGLNRPAYDLPFGPCVEIGWRLATEHWGKGYATEAARAALDHGFGALDLDEIVSFTAPANLRSRAVMERLGFTRDRAGDFDHPLIPAGHRLRRLVLYRLRRADAAHRRAAS